MTRQRWSEDKIVEAFKKLHREKQPLNAESVQRTNYPLYSAACRYFGGWANVAKAAGSDYETIRVTTAPPRIWTRDKVTKEIKRLHRKKMPLDQTSLRDANSKLLNGGIYAFGSWKEAIEAAGLDYSTITRIQVGHWNKQQVVNDIQGFAKNGVRLGAYFIKTNYTNLYNAAVKYCGGWKNAIEAAGFSYEAIQERKNSYWNKKTIVAHIRRLARNGFRLSHRATREEYPDLLTAARRIFGSWCGAVQAAGIDYLAHSERWSYKAWLRKAGESRLQAIGQRVKTFSSKRSK